MTKAETAGSDVRATTPGGKAGQASPKTMTGKSPATAKAPADKLSVFIVVPIAMFSALAYVLYQTYTAGKAAAIDDTFANTPWAAPIFATSCYMFFVHVGGPKLMANRAPMMLKNWMLIYNVYQTLLNIATCYFFVKAVYDLNMSWWGNELDLSSRTYDLGFWIWCHYTNKYVELLDTVFMILRKKSEQVSFLHVYHHCLLIWAWFAVAKVACGGDAYFGALANSFIHVLMYSYYAMALLRIQVPWKKVLTQLQMVQFVVCATHSFYVLYSGCYPARMAVLELWVMFNMLFLFWNFYSKKYNRGKVLWTIIDGTRYDISKFIEKHPGGSDLLMLAVGRDASVMFHSYHRRYSVVHKRLATMPVLKELPEPKKDGSRLTCATPNEHKNKPVLGVHSAINTPLYNEIRDEVNRYFKETGKSSRGGMIMKSLLLVAATGTCFYFTAVEGYFWAAPLMGVLMAMNGLAIQHDANHGAFHPNHNINRIASLLDDVIGGSALMWRHQHDIAHHAHPNDVEMDADTFSQFPILRMNPELPLRGYLKFQHIYAPFLYTCIGLMYSFLDVVSFVKGRHEHVRLQPLRFQDKFFFWAGKLVHFGLTLGVPLYYHGLAGLVYFYLPTELVGGFFLASVFAVSHNSEVTAYNLPRDMDWAEMQIRTSCNWGPKSSMWLYMVGGLNFQIEHHLFPGVAHIHYPAISKIVKRVCAKHDIPYGEFEHFRTLYKSHLSTLYKLGHYKNLAAADSAEGKKQK